MILSHKHQFIFLKTNKTAGTSVEIALSRFCGPGDIITRITPEDELLRASIGGIGPQNFTGDGRAPSGPPATDLFYNHMSALEVRALVDSDVWESYFKFCVERNPWERVISLYHWRVRRMQPRPTLGEFIENGPLSDLRERGLGIYTIEGDIVADRILRYENLEVDLERVRQDLRLPMPLNLPRAKAGFRKDKRPYSDIMTQAEIDAVGAMFKEEVDLLGYRPDKSSVETPPSCI